MPIDAGIYGNLLRSPKTVQEYDAEAQQAKASQLQNALGQIQYSNALRQQQDDQAYREAAKGFGSDTNANASALFSKGLVKEGLAYQKSALDALKTTTDINKDQATADKTSYELRIQKANEAVKDISSLMSPQQARDSISRHMKAGDITFEQASQMLATVPDDMGDFGRWRNQTVMRILDAKTRLEMSMAKPEKFDNGGQIITRDMNPNSPTYGQNTGGDPIVKVATPGDLIRQGNNIHSNAHMSANAGGGAGGVANAGGAPAKPAKPLPVAALKMQQDSLDAIGTAGGINADLGAVLQQVESGSLQLGPVKNAVGSVRNTLGISNENSQNLATFKATLEKLRNDSLRLNKGVQTDGDAQRAWNELLSNINDPGVVAKRLKEIRSLNSRAIELHNDNLDNIRSNYGAQPIDTTKRATQKPAIESAVKRINSDEEYNALPSGATFIAPDGKTRRKP